MTLPEEATEWQARERERRRTGRKPSPSKPDGKSARFAPLNALADGGWLGVLSWRELRVWVALFRLADGSSRLRASVAGSAVAEAAVPAADPRVVPPPCAVQPASVTVRAARAGNMRMATSLFAIQRTGPRQSRGSWWHEDTTEKV